MRNGLGFAGSALAGGAPRPRSEDETPIIVRARGSRVEPGGLPSALLGSKPPLLNERGALPGASACSTACKEELLAFAFAFALPPGGSTLKLVPHLGQRIFRPFSGTRFSSTW
jgi:hypothetical protein